MFLSPEILISQYKKGIFPMSDSTNDPYIYWVDPEERGLIKLDDFKFSNSLKKLIKKNAYSIEVNKNFKKVINFCAKNKSRESSWINNQIIENYYKLFIIGKAKSIECYEGNNLVGGLYGVSVGRIFCGESMFSLKKNTSKISLVYLVAFLKEGGYKFIDTQFYSDHLKQFGTKKVSRREYLEILDKNIDTQKKFPTKLKKNILDYFQ